MGWNPFKTKKKTIIQVDSMAQPLFAANPDVLGQAVVKAVLEKQSISDEIIETMLNGNNRNMVRAYNWAKDNYYLGLPSGTAEYLEYDEDAIASVLQSIEGKPVTLTSVDLDFEDADMVVTDYLYKTLGYDPTTGHLLGYTTPDATWLATAKAEINSEIVAKQAALKTYVESFAVNPVKTEATQLAVQQDDGTYKFISATRTITQTVELTESKTPTYISSAARIYDKYILSYGSLDAEGARIYANDRQQIAASCSYVCERFLSETIKVVPDEEGYDELITETTNLLRTDRFVDDSSHYRSASTAWTHDMTLTLSVKERYYYVEYTVEGVAKTWLYKLSDNTYPTLSPNKTLDDVSPYFPIIPLRRDNKDLARESNRTHASYTSGSRLLKIMGLDFDDLATAINANPDVKEIDHAYVFCGVPLQTENEGGLRYLAEYFHYLYLNAAPKEDRLMFGRVTAGDGVINQLISKLRWGVTSIRIKDGGLDLEYQYTHITSEVKTGVIGKQGKATRKTDSNNKWVRFQLQLSENSYREIFVYDLRQINYIYGTHTKIDTIETSRSDTTEFIIPLHYGILSDLPITVRNVLHTDTLHMVFNVVDIQIVKLKWYQHGLGKFLLTAAAVVAFAYGAYHFATGLMAATSAAAYILTTVAISMALRYVFKIIVKAIGVDAAMILAVVATAWGISGGFSADGLPWADEMLMVANGINSGIQDNLADLFTDLEGEIELFSKETEEKLEELDAAKSLLEVSGIIDPLLFTKTEPLIRFDESPTEYYFRTTHIGNAGALALDAITKYVDIKLELPKPDYAII